MLKTLFLSIGVVACATGSPITQTPARAKPVAKPRAVPVAFPARRTVPELPSARALSPRLMASGPLSAQLELCVSPDGETASVALRSSSGDRAFDDMVIGDASQWRYEPFNAAATQLACENATITLVP
jgi:hypothetical protein